MPTWLTGAGQSRSRFTDCDCHSPNGAWASSTSKSRGQEVEAHHGIYQTRQKVMRIPYHTVELTTYYSLYDQVTDGRTLTNASNESTPRPLRTDLKFVPEPSNLASKTFPGHIPNPLVMIIAQTGCVEHFRGNSCVNTVSLHIQIPYIVLKPTK